MEVFYAKEFKEILPALASQLALRDHVVKLILSEPNFDKATEGGTRLTLFREILASVVTGDLPLREAYSRVEHALSRHSSIHSENNRVFASGWGERLVRTQLSRFYNHAVLEGEIEKGHAEVFVHHSSEEDAGSTCSRELAGKTHDARSLYEGLLECFTKNNWKSGHPKLPHHPHCTHVVAPSAS